MGGGMYIFFISRVMAEGKFDYIALDWLADEYPCMVVVYRNMREAWPEHGAATFGDIQEVTKLEPRLLKGALSQWIKIGGIKTVAHPRPDGGAIYYTQPLTNLKQLKKSFPRFGKWVAKQPKKPRKKTLKQFQKSLRTQKPKPKRYVLV